MNKVPIYLFPRPQKNATPLRDFLPRLSLYSKSWQELSGTKDKVLVFVCGENRENLDEIHATDSIEVIHFIDLYNNLILFSLRSFFEIKRRKIKPILIAGDPIFGSIAAFTIRFFSRMVFPVQIQIHGDIYNHSAGIKSFLRSNFAKISIRWANSVRLVSKFQKDEVLKFANNNPDKFFVAPIPTEISTLVRTQFSSKIMRIAFIGRIHHERNYKLWARLAWVIASIDKNVEFEIIGDGPEFSDFKALLVDIPSVVIWTGRITNDEVLNHLSNIDVLISTAEKESYGLAIREAVLHGVQVIALRNMGSEAALDDFPNGVVLFSNVSEFGKLWLEVSSLKPNIEATYFARSKQEKLNKESVLRIAESWII